MGREQKAHPGLEFGDIDNTLTGNGLNDYDDIVLDSDTDSSTDAEGDFFTKPLQGALFRKFHNIIMNIPDDHPCNDGIADAITIVDATDADNNDRSVLDESNGPCARTDCVYTLPEEVRTAHLQATENGWVEVAHKQRKMNRSKAQKESN